MATSVTMALVAALIWLRLLTPRPHFTAPSCTLGNQVVGASDGAPFGQGCRPTHVCRTPGAGSGPLLAEARTLRAGDYSDVLRHHSVRL